MKKTYWYCLFLYFFTTLDIIWPKFCPMTTPNLIFFAGFQSSLLWNSINIKNFNWNPVILTNFLLKPLKITNFWPNLCKNGVPMGHPQNTFFFSEITKPDPKLSKPFCFNKRVPYVLLTELWMFFYTAFLYFL